MKNFNPLTVKEFNNLNMKDNKANCMLFAFGTFRDKSKSILDYNLWGFRSTPIKEIVEEAGKKFGNIKLRKIISTNEAPENSYIIGFYLKKTNDDYIGYDYHFIRRELDGSWVEKPGWIEPACTANLADLRIEYGMDPVLFVVEGVL